MRGEHDGNRFSMVERTGSSPHARGTPGVAERTPPPAGIIPACAGNTTRPSSPSPAVRDHPRMRGEHALMNPAVVPVAGSSPHARGTRNEARGRSARGRIIPACAGNTIWSGCSRRGRGDHPRMRGEHVGLDPFKSLAKGSSPHARGTLPRRNPRRHGMGIIPACAGNTTSPWRGCESFRDHPRMRGEHAFRSGMES